MDEIKAIFNRLEQSLKQKDEDLFRAQWHTEGYTTNITGRSGLSGSRLFEQGSRKGWYPKPDFSKALTLETVVIVPCEIWSWEKDRSVDEVYMAISSQPLLLGGGEDLEEVQSLAHRFLKGEPLAPSN